MSTFLPTGLTATAYASIATAHLCECVAHAPKTQAHHWATAVAYTVLGLLAALALARSLAAGDRPADHGPTGPRPAPG